MNKKLLLTALITAVAVGATAGSADAGYSTPDKYGVVSSVFNPAYRPLQDDWALQTGFAFRTGRDADETNMNSFSSGDFMVDDFRVAYGIMDELYVSIDVHSNTFELSPYTDHFIIGGFANPELGVNWQIMRPAKSFALDVIGKYGAAWTKYAGTDIRIGMNNLQAGFRIYGDEGRFQWAAQSLAQMAWTPEFITESDTMWNLLSRVELEFEIVEKVGLRGEFNFNVYDLGENLGESAFYDMYAQLGLVVDVMPGVAAIQPYVGYHPKTAVTGSPNLPNNYWQIGAKFGVQF